MIKKFIVSFLCVVFIAGVIFSGISFLYFAIPSKQAMNSISLPSTVEDSEETESASTEEEENSEDIYVAGLPKPKSPKRNTHASIAMIITRLMPNRLITNGMSRMQSVSDTCDSEISMLACSTPNVP